MNIKILLLAALLSPSLATAAKPKKIINGLACPELVGGTYAKTARKLGLEYLVVVMTPDRFGQLMKAAQKTSPFFRASGLGALDPSGMDLFTEPSERHDHSMKPLLRQDSGKWAHQLIGSAADIQGDGYRTKLHQHWRIGLVYPVEILDHIPFTMTSTRTIGDRKMKINSGRGGELFNSEREHAEEYFEDILQDEISNPPYPSQDFDDYFQFHFEKGVPLELAALFWIPAPLINAAGLEGFPGVQSPLLPQPGQPFQIKIRKDGQYLSPPKENLFDYFDPKRRVGVWFNTIPDWNVVRESLAKEGPPMVEMLRYKTNEE